MANAKWFSSRILFRDGELRETAKALLREVYLESVGGEFGEECWIFPGGKTNPEGYRYVDWNGSNRVAHRFIHELFNGPIPEGAWVLHSCDNKPCCNPRHLRTGTALQNTADMFARGRSRSGMAAKTHCPHGHEYTPENTQFYQDRRYCRACHKVQSREYQKRARAKLKQR